MRIWDVPPRLLCRQHLLGEHRELHGLWNILTQDKPGYSKHPETQRWRGKTLALYFRHYSLVSEMIRRGYNHHTPLNLELAQGPPVQEARIDSIEAQIEILRGKGCECNV